MVHDEVQELRRQIAASELHAEQIEHPLLVGWAEDLTARESGRGPCKIVRSNVELPLTSHPGDGLRSGAPSLAAPINAALRVAARSTSTNS